MEWLKDITISGMPAWGVIPAENYESQNTLGMMVFRTREDAEKEVGFQQKRYELLRKKATSCVAPVEKDTANGFTEGMNPLDAARTIKTLNTTQGFSRVFVTRREYIEKAISEGATVVYINAEPVLKIQSGGYYTQKDITKTAIAYAKYLQERM